MESRRVKISFEYINEGKFTVIEKRSIAATNQRVKAVMKGFVRTYEKKESESMQQAALLVLNA